MSFELTCLSVQQPFHCQHNYITAKHKLLVLCGLQIQFLLPVCHKIFIIFLHGLGPLTCSGIDALPSFPGASTISSSSRFVVEGVFRESGVVHSFKVTDPVLFVCESHVLYSRDL